jgi:hypothetical protein
MIRRVFAATASFLAVLAAVKIAFALVPSQGFLRDDGLFPLWALWERGTAWVWFFPPFAIAVGVLLSAWRWGLDRIGAPAFLAIGMFLTAGVETSMALTNSGFPSGLTAPFERDEDYWSAVPRFVSEREVWSTYTTAQPDLPLHAKTHPPGAVAVLKIVSRLVGGSLLGACVTIVLLGTLTVLPLYAWAREAAGERAARRAVVLWGMAPAILLYGATCMDMVFAVPLVTAAWSFHRAVKRNDPGSAALAGLALGVGLLFTFAGAIAAFAFVLSAASRRAFRPLAIAAATSIAVLAAVYAMTGFNWWACFRQAARIDAAEWPAWSSSGYFVWTRLMDVFDALVMFGAALSALWVGVLRRGIVGAPGLVAWSRAAAIACVVAFLAGAFKIGETGRILMFVLPAAVIPVAKLLEDDDRALGLVAAAGFLQAVVFEAVLDTRW